MVDASRDTTTTKDEKKEKDAAKERLKTHLLFQAADASDMQRWVTAINSIAEYEWLVLYQDETVAAPSLIVP